MSESIFDSITDEMLVNEFVRRMVDEHTAIKSDLQWLVDYIADGCPESLDYKVKAITEHYGLE